VDHFVVVMAKFLNDNVSYNRFDQISVPLLFKSGYLEFKHTRSQVRRQTPNYLFHYITEGSGWVKFSKSEPLKLKRGDWFFCYPGQEMTYAQDVNNPWLYRWIEFYGKDVDSMLRTMGIFKDTHVKSGGYHSQIEKYFEKMRVLLSEGEISSSLRASSCLGELFSFMFEQSTYTKQISKPRLESVHDGIDKAIHFMENHYVEGIQVNQVIDYVGFERTYFSKIFSLVTGKSLRNYLSDLREKQAKALLKDSHLTIADVATTVGFHEPKSFSRFFSSKTGLSPVQWRKKIKP